MGARFHLKRWAALSRAKHEHSLGCLPHITGCGAKLFWYLTALWPQVTVYRAPKSNAALEVRRE